MESYDSLYEKMEQIRQAALKRQEEKAYKDMIRVRDEAIEKFKTSHPKL